MYVCVLTRCELSNRGSQGQRCAFGSVDEMSLGTCFPYFIWVGVRTLVLIQLPVNVYPERHQVMAPASGSLFGILMLLASSWSSLSCYRCLGSEPGDFQNTKTCLKIGSDNPVFCRHPLECCLFIKKYHQCLRL